MGTSDRDTAVVIVAGGSGERFGSAAGKQLAMLAGRPLLSRTVERCCESRDVALAVVVVPAGREDEYRAALLGAETNVVRVEFAFAGTRRQDSVMSGLGMVPEEIGYIAVHDGARPLVTAEILSAARRYLDARSHLDGVVVGHPSFDTLKHVRDGVVIGTPDRSEYWIAQTPQLFRASALRRAYHEAARTGRVATDDAGLVEASGGSVGVIEGSRDNIKVTVASDLALAEALLAARSEEGRT